MKQQTSAFKGNPSKGNEIFDFAGQTIFVHQRALNANVKRPKQPEPPTVGFNVKRFNRKRFKTSPPQTLSFPGWVRIHRWDRS